MPCLTVQTNIADNQITDDFLKQLSANVAQALGKPEQYVAVQVSAGQKLFFAGTNDPAVLMELVSIGLPTDKTANISKQIMSLFEEQFHIKTDRIYLKFTNVAGNMMGWNKGTF
jgi:2C-methyl-D-erythritol 2,4-cyclodiphosphate synthase